MTHEASNVEAWSYPDGLAEVWAWSCDCMQDGDHGSGYPSLREALEAALAHVTEAEAK